MTAAHSAPLKLILLVEDNPDDVLLTRMALEKAGVRHPLYSVSSGIEAISYLSGDPPYSERSRHPLPSVVLLDIKLPSTDGIEVLKWIRRHPDFAQLPVIMLTGSNEMREMNNAYQVGASSFMVKPINAASAAEFLRSLD